MARGDTEEELSQVDFSSTEHELQASDSQLSDDAALTSSASVLSVVNRILSSRRLRPTLVIALFFAIISWPVMDLVPQAGLDPSWQAGLAMAFHQRLQWGAHIDFTYGPLGFLTLPILYYGNTAALSLAYLLLSRSLVFALLLRASRPKFSPYWSLLAAFIVGASAIALVDPADLLMGCALLIAVEAILSRSERTVIMGTAFLAAVAGVGLLMKFSVGVLTLGAAALVIISMPKRLRNTGLGVGTFVLTLLVLWIATGNSPGYLLPFLHMSTSIAAGYSGAMSLEVGRVDEWYYAFILLACLAILLWLALRSSPLTLRLCTGLLFLWFAWLALKEGYVRHDGHDLEFLGLMLLAFIAVPWPARRNSDQVAAAIGLATVLAWTAAGGIPSNVVSLATNTRSLFSDAATVLIAGRRDSVISTARSALQMGYALPPSMLSQLKGQTVAIEPYENTVAWAFSGFKWDPEPVLQQYSAYESTLDNLDASFLRSSSAPTRILAQPAVEFEGIYQDPFFESPNADVATICRYEQVGVTSSWQLLDRISYRCGKLRVIKALEPEFGHTVSVPSAPAGDAVLATFGGVGSSLVYRGENFVLKARAIEMQTSAGDFRFISGTESDLHILRVPPTLGYARAFSPPIITSFSITERDLGTNSGRYHVTFYDLRIKSATSSSSPPSR